MIFLPYRHEKCWSTDCRKLAVKQVILSFSFEPNTPANQLCKAELGMKVCEDHAIPDPSIYAPNAMWEQIVWNFGQMHLRKPLRETIQVEFVTILIGAMN